MNKDWQCPICAHIIGANLRDEPPSEFLIQTHLRTHMAETWIAAHELQLLSIEELQKLAELPLIEDTQFVKSGLLYYNLAEIKAEIYRRETIYDL